LLIKNKYTSELIKICLIYLVLGSVWISFSDRLANLISDNKDTLTMISTYKGWFYVVVTGVVLYYLLDKMLKKIELAETTILHNNQELVAAHQELEATNEEISQQYDELKSFIGQLRINQDRLNRAQAIAHVGNWDLDLGTKTMWASEEAYRIYGIEQESSYLALKKAQGLVHPEDRTLMDSALSRLIHYQDKYDVIYRINRESDGVERVIQSVAIIEHSEDNSRKILGVIRDITEQHLAEKQIRYFADHDAVTGLYNRRFFEQEISEISENADTIGILICDVDGLKLINDTMGHEEGDRYLISCAQILTESCPLNSIIARIGGDEFAIILKDVKADKITETYSTIQQKVGEYNLQTRPIPLSLSIGSNHCYSCGREKVSQALKEAEEKMYFNKLLQSQSTRSGTVDLLMKTLEARDYITEGHTDRLQTMVGEMAVKIGMNELEKSKLSLFARFHDIGKVGIRDVILFKPGKLDIEEFEEMKKHSEIGFRIANSSPDLGHISDFILKHHEWWNGQGYPLRLAGEEIPLECRILAIVDAYDSMSNDRPYRKAMSYPERIAELHRFSGIQFDPYLVPVFIDMLEEMSRETTLSAIVSESSKS